MCIRDRDGGKDTPDNIVAACHVCNQRRHKPVSYTHLDVYKRQGMHLVYDDKAQVLEELRPLGVMRQDRLVEHVRICLLYTSRCV